MRRREFLSLTTVAPALVAVRPWRRGQARPPIDDIAGLVTEAMAKYHVPGVALGLVRGSELAIRVFGVTNVDDPQPITPDTIFTVASISKSVTATAVMRLVEQGKVDLDSPVQKYIAEFRVQDEAASRAVTIRHLLTHTPGWEGQLSTEDRGIDALAHFATTIMRDLPQLAAPGSVWSYNNAGFALAGRAIEVVTGRGIHDALRELVFTPAGLTRTFTRLPDVMPYRFSLGHREQGGRTQVIRPVQTTSSTTAGGVMTTVTDLMRYARLHLGDLAMDNAKPILPDALRLAMQTPQLVKNSTDDEMGVGWHLRKLGGVQTCAHGGTLNGHCLLVEFVPVRNLAFAILTNHTDGWRLVQDVESAILRQMGSLALSPNQRIGHRGVNEAMTFHSTPLATQPPVAEYVGTYQRPPLGSVQVREANGVLTIGGGNGAGTPVTFYGRDVAYASAASGGNYLGSPYEFIRRPDGAVGWIRVNGRIAKRTG